MTTLFFLSLFLVFLAVDARTTLVVCDEQVGEFPTDGIWKHLPKPTCPDVINPKFGLFTKYNPSQPVYLARDAAIPDQFASNRRTVFVVHGYWNDFNTQWLHDTKDAFLEREDINVVVVGWGGGSKMKWYPNSATNTRSVGAELSVIVNKLVTEAGTDVRDVWCVGHSLGAHTCGQLGLRVKIGRITGLDPAGPWFEGQHIDTRLDETDADFVDVIHTDGWGLACFYGLLTPSGHVDYYPNGGYYQPGCWTASPDEEGQCSPGDWQEGLQTYGGEISCSHSRAPKFFIESLRRPSCFPSYQKCTDPNKVPKSCTACEGELCSMMGYEADKHRSRTGLFYVETTSKAPFCPN